MDGEERSPPRKRARLSPEHGTDPRHHETHPAHESPSSMTTITPVGGVPSDRLLYFRSFLARAASSHDEEEKMHDDTPTTDPNILPTIESAIMVKHEVERTEESNTDDEDLQTMSMKYEEGIRGDMVMTHHSELSFEAVYNTLFQSAKENNHEAVEKVLRFVKTAPNGHEMMRQLVAEEDESGLTLLMIAVRNDNVHLCGLLTAEGADVNQMNEKRPHALMLAAQKGFRDASRFLLENGVNDESKSMALIPAAHFGHLDVVKLLLEHGANQNYANKKGTTPLMRAAQEGRVTVVQFLIDKGAIASAANNEGMTALMLAAQRGHAEIATALIRSGSDVNTQTRQGSTALLLAAKRGHAAAVEALLTAGADLYLKDDRNKTAAETAHRRGHVDLFLKITVSNQLRLMREGLRRERYAEIMRLSYLYVLSRAQFAPTFKSPRRRRMLSLLDRTMKLPRPLLQNVALYLPLCHVWDRQLRYLIHETPHHSSRVVQHGIRIMDELLLSVALEVRSTLHPLRRAQSDPASGQLALLRDCPEFRAIFAHEITLPLTQETFKRLRQMADLQGAMQLYPVGTAIQFNADVAQDVVSLVSDLLSWDAARKRVELLV